MVDDPHMLDLLGYAKFMELVIFNAIGWPEVASLFHYYFFGLRLLFVAFGSFLRHLHSCFFFFF